MSPLQLIIVVSIILLLLISGIVSLMATRDHQTRIMVEKTFAAFKGFVGNWTNISHHTVDSLSWQIKIGNQKDTTLTATRTIYYKEDKISSDHLAINKANKTLYLRFLSENDSLRETFTLKSFANGVAFFENKQTARFAVFKVIDKDHYSFQTGEGNEWVFSRSK